MYLIIFGSILIVNMLGGLSASKNSFYGRTIQAFLGNDANELDKMPDAYEFFVKNLVKLFTKEDSFSYSSVSDSVLTRVYK